VRGLTAPVSRKMGRLRAQDREQRIEQGQVDHLPVAAVVLDLAQRDHCGRGPIEAGHAIGEIHRGQHRLAIREAIERRKAGQPFDQRSEAGTLTVGPVLTPAGNAHDDQLGIELVAIDRVPAPFSPECRGGSFRSTGWRWRRASAAARRFPACASRHTGSFCCARRFSSGSRCRLCARRAAYRLRWAQP